MNKLNEPKKNRNKFLHIMLVTVLVIFVIAVTRLGQIMVLGRAHNVDLRQNAIALYNRSSILPAKRGTIYDIGGNPVAMDATSYSLYAVLTDNWVDKDAEPIHVEDKEKTAEVLSKHINMSKEDILATLNSESDQVAFGSAGRDLSFAEMDAIRQENLQGITFEETPTRLYPNGVFASHLIGFSEYKQANDVVDSRLTGQLGLELSEDGDLSGKNGKTQFQTNYGNYQLPAEEKGEQVLPENGQDIYTTLDSRLQTYLETLMTYAFETYEPKTMTAMLVEPDTGKISAATQRPTFNSQTREGIDEMWENLLVEHAYEPGSTIKVITLAVAIEEGVFDPTGMYQSGKVEIGGGVISDYNKVGWGVISQLEGLSQSSNTLMVKLVGEIGYDKWKEYLEEFGFLESTDSGFANEDPGSMTYEYELDKVNTAFGQGIRVTPWQMMQAYTAIANDGNMMELKLVDRYQDENGDIQVVEPQKIGSPISAETAQLTLDYLTEVVYADTGTGKEFAIEGTEVSAKTGTAEIYDTEQGKYLTGEHDYIYSVAGFAPTDDPKYILYITMQQPSKNLDQASPNQILADVFVPLMTRALEYDSLSTDAGYEQKEMPNVVGTDTNEALQAVGDAGFLKTQTLGDGREVAKQLPQAGTNYSIGDPVYLVTNDNLSIPDFTGLTMAQSQALADLIGIKIIAEGDGIVVGQDISVGKPIEGNGKIELQLQQP